MLGIAVDALLMILFYLAAAFFVYLADDICGGSCRVEALYQVCSEVDNGLELLGCLDSLSKSLDAVVVAEVDYLADEVLLLGIFVDIAEERAVYLDEVGHISQQIAHV